MYEYLLIGGHNDGKRVSRPRILSELPMRFVLPQRVSAGRNYPPEKISYEIEKYVLQKIRGKDQTFIVYLAKGLNPDEMIDRLIKGYA